MGRIFARSIDEVAWEQTRNTDSAGNPGYIRRKIMGDEANGPYARVTEYSPGFYEQAHSHDADEYIFVLEGELTIGDTTYKKGTLIFIEANTVYGPLKGGPNGLRFFILRPASTKYYEAKTGRALPDNLITNR